MGRIYVVAAVLLAAAPASAQIRVTELTAKYAEGNIVRVIARVKMPAPPASAFRVAMLKAATMAGQKGYTRLALVKVDDCVSLGINNGPAIVQMCKVFGQMVTPNEVALPKGDAPVRYFTLVKDDDGTYVPELEGAK